MYQTYISLFPSLQSTTNKFAAPSTVHIIILFLPKVVFLYIFLNIATCILLTSYKQKFIYISWHNNCHHSVFFLKFWYLCWYIFTSHSTKVLLCLSLSSPCHALQKLDMLISILCRIRTNLKTIHYYYHMCGVLFGEGEDWSISVGKSLIEIWIYFSHDIRFILRLNVFYSMLC